MSLQPWIGQALPQERVRRRERLDVGARLFRFGRFCVVPATRQLLADGRPVPLGGRAFDLLLVLLRARGDLVSKDEILNCVWPSLAVEEANLRFQMAALRRALGEDRDIIKTVTGRGYLLAVELAREPAEADAAVGLDLADEELDEVPGAVPALGHWRPVSIAPARPDTQPMIAVIDDDPGVRGGLHGLLRSVGMRAVVYASVQEFLDQAPESPPQCLILDVWLPERNGLDFHAELARADVKLPVIFISGHADVPMSVRAMKAGAVDFLTKPVHHLDLLNAIRRAIRIPSEA